MARWPLALRLIVALVLFGATAWAFATGHMALSILGIAASALAFHRFFLSDI